MSRNKNAENTQQYLRYQDEAKQISSTGARALLVLVSLYLGSKSFEEIKQFLIDCGFANSQYSTDTVRMDLNTLKAIGCTIKKATKSNNHKYTLTSHPFKVNITPFEVNFIRGAYKSISKTCSPETLLKYHYLFEKLGEISNDEDIKEALLGISILKDTNLEIVKSLVGDEKLHNKIKIAYLQTKYNEVFYEITLERLGIRSDKLYAFCYNHTQKKRGFLKVSKITRIIEKSFDKTSQFGLDAYVKFSLVNQDKYSLEPNETIIDTLPDKIMVEGRYFNEFIAMQRILSFGEDCVVVEPEEVKELIIEKLLEMKELYAGS